MTRQGSLVSAPRWEAEVLFGLEEFAEDELRQRLGPSVHVLGRAAPGRVSFAYVGADGLLDTLRSVVALHRVASFDVPRPKALLGHEHLTRLIGSVRAVIAHQAPGAFGTFRLSAAGADSAVFQRLKGEIARQTGLTLNETEADLQLAVRPAPSGQGWQVLIRRTPRPQSLRAWRVRNMPGALDATIAHVMVSLAGPRPDERFLNVACGSGTLLIERLALGAARAALGVDRDTDALEAARANLRASGHADDGCLLVADAGHLPVATASCDTVVVDLPWGLLVGSRRENERLYPALLSETARGTAPGGCLVAITASHGLFEQSLAQTGDRWRSERIIEVQVPWEHGYLRPHIYLLRRTGA